MSVSCGGVNGTTWVPALLASMVGGDTLDGVCGMPYSNECELDTLSVSSARFESSSFSRASMVFEGVPVCMDTAPSDSNFCRIASHPVRSSISFESFGSANLT